MARLAANMEAISAPTALCCFRTPTPTPARRRCSGLFTGLPCNGGDRHSLTLRLRRRSSRGSHRPRPLAAVEDDLDSFLAILPEDLQEVILNTSKGNFLVEIILDLGRLPEAWYLGESGGQSLRTSQVTTKELEYVLHAVGGFQGDNRAGIPGTLHRISAIKNREGAVVGLTCRVGRAVNGAVDMVYDLLDYGKNILFIGRPGAGKTTAIRDAARVLSNELSKRVVIVDTSNEIGGDGDVPHPAIGSARRLQVPKPSLQHRVMIEAVENHMPQVVIVDEITTEAEAAACQSIAERGVMIIGTAHGETIESIVKNPCLSRLVGGVQTVTLGDEEARIRGNQKIVLERKALPTFPFIIEMRERCYWVMHHTARSVDKLLLGTVPLVEVRRLDNHHKVLVERWSAYTRV